MIDNSEIFKMAERGTALAKKYQEFTKELILIKRKKALAWIQFRSEVESDTQATRKWEMTDDGIRETELKYILRALQMERSALNKEIDVLRDESRNQY